MHDVRDRATHHPVFLNTTHNKGIAALQGPSRSVKSSEMVVDIAVKGQ